MQYFRCFIFMNTPPILQIREVQADELIALTNIARSTFYESFAPFNAAEDMEHYMSQSLSFDQVKREFDHPESRFYFCETDGAIIAYLKLNWGQAQTDDVLENALEVQRIYVAASHQGKKIGQLLWDFALEMAGETEVDRIWLGVWEKNEGAIRFYQRNGLELFSKHDFYLGQDLQTDWMMKLELN